MVAGMKVELCELAFRYAHLRGGGGGQRQRLRASLAEEGQRVPVLLVRDGDALVLIDGYARCDALRSLGRDVVDAAVLDGDEVDALVLSHQLVCGRRKTALEQAWLVAELIERHGLTQSEVAGRLGKSKSWVSRHRAMTTLLPVTVRAAIERGEVSVQVARRKKIPLARANAQACGTLVEQLGEHRLTVREAKALHEAWRGADEAQRGRIVTAPQLYLKVHAHRRGDNAVPEAARALGLAEQLRERVDALRGLVERSDLPTWRLHQAHLRRQLERLRRQLRGIEATLENRDERGGEHARCADESRGLEAP